MEIIALDFIPDHCVLREQTIFYLWPKPYRATLIAPAALVLAVGKSYTCEIKYSRRDQTPEHKDFHQLKHLRIYMHTLATDSAGSETLTSVVHTLAPQGKDRAQGQGAPRLYKAARAKTLRGPGELWDQIRVIAEQREISPNHAAIVLLHEAVRHNDDKTE